LTQQKQDLETKNSDLIEKVARLEGQVSTLTGEKTSLTTQLNAERDKSKNYDDLCRKFEETKELVSDIYKRINDLNSILGNGNNNNTVSAKKNENKTKKKNNDLSWIKPQHVFILIIVLFGVLFFVLTGSDDKNEYYDEVKNKLTSVGDNNQSDKNIGEDSVSIRSVYGNNYDNDSSFLKYYKDARIDIEGISSYIPMRKDSLYKVSLKNVEDYYNYGGIWESEDFVVHDNIIRPKHSGDCTIVFVINGVEVISRTINVKE
ncbi:MAG: hypothetical protein SOW56_04095, partial [Bacteroidaceae bacterium]|nr:hypothetical protein [Bacteroidaceae bacterium]